MLGKWFQVGGLAVVAGAALLFAAGPAFAQHRGGGGGHGGGFHGGGGHAGSFHSGGFHGGGFHGSTFHGSTFHSGGHFGYYRPYYRPYYHNRSYFYGYYSPGFYYGYPYAYNYPYYYGTSYPYDYGTDVYPYGADYYGSDTPPVRYQAYYPPDAPAGVANTVQIDVVVPPAAEIWFNGVKTSQSGAYRQFVSPALTPGQDYHYNLEARWVEGGRTVTRTRTVTIHAGDHLSLNLRATR
jgi:uncharacterized protein (TIGR03000 family)